MFGLGLALPQLVVRRLGAGGVVAPAVAQIFGNRKQMPSNNLAINAANQFQRSVTLAGYTSGGEHVLRSTFINGIQAPGGILPSPDALLIERFGYRVGGTYYPSTLNNVTLPGGAAVAPVLNTPAVTIPAIYADGTPVYEEVCYAAATSTSRLPLVGSPYCYGLSGEGWIGSSSSQAANAGTAVPGTVPLGSIYVGRVMPMATWRISATRFNDGVLKMNDSIGQGSVTPFHTYDARGNIGFMARMLDDTTGGRKQYLDLGMYSTGIATNDPALTAEVTVKMLKRVLDDLGPFHIPVVCCQLCHNDAGVGATGMKAAFGRLRAYVAANFGNPRWVQLGLTGRIATTDYATSLAGQTANSAAWGNTVGTFMRDIRDWFAAGADGLIDAYIPHHLAVHDADGVRFTDNTAKGTLANAVTANSTSTIVVDVTSGTFKVGQLIAFEPTDGTNFDADNRYFVFSISGAGSQKTIGIRNVSPFAQNVVKAHAAGSAVSSRILNDTEHLPGDGHDAMLAYCLPRKAAAFALAA